MSNREKHLFSEFPAVTTEEWEQVIKKDLKGADYKKKLTWHTGEGIEVLPFYRKEDLKDIKFPVSDASGKHDRWEIRQPVFEQDISKANRTARRAIERGADALQFKVQVRYTDGMLGGDLEGTAIQSQATFSKLLQGIDIQRVSLHFDSGMVSPALIALLLNEYSDKNIDPSKVQSTFLFDPYAFTITNGLLPKQEEDFLGEARQLVEIRKKELPGAKPLGIDARIYHHAGATIVQELGYALATGSEYLAKLSGFGLTVDEIVPAIHFNFSIGSGYFLEIAKFRAARLLWSRILEAYEYENENGKGTGSENAQERPAMYLHGESSRWNKTVFDPYTNVLRITTEGMAAAIAGCDAITLNPFDLQFRQPDEFSQRISRNAQIILQEEAYLDKVKDPSAGSYYIEKLTDKIAEAAWDCFQEVEQQGGILQSVKGGYIQTAVEESRERRDRAIATRRRIFVGTNQYPVTGKDMAKQERSGYRTVSLKETDNKAHVDHSAIIPALGEAFQNGSTLGDIVPELYELSKHDIRPIRPYRGPQAFEQLRLATHNHTHNHDSTPVVLTIPIGDRKMRKERSTFAANLFGCAGYDIHDPISFDSVSEAVHAVREEKPDIAVICSSDEEYKQLVPELCDELKKTDKKPVIVLAGYPDKEEETEKYSEVGVDEFIHAKSNVLETLKHFQQKLGIMERG